MYLKEIVVFHAQHCQLLFVQGIIEVLPVKGTFDYKQVHELSELRVHELSELQVHELSEPELAFDC